MVFKNRGIQLIPIAKKHVWICHNDALQLASTSACHAQPFRDIFLDQVDRRSLVIERFGKIALTESIRFEWDASMLSRLHRLKQALSQSAMRRTQAP